MGPVEAIVTYLVLWWLTLFAVLPWGNRVPDEIEEGHASSAPAKPRLWLKAGVTTLIAGILFIIVYIIVTFGLIEIRPPQ